MAVDVLDHDDGVVDDEADSDREGHQREIVEAEAHEIHEGGRAQQGEGDRDARDQRRPEAAQEQEDHGDDESHGDEERALNVGDGGTDGLGPVREDLDLDRRRERRLELGEDLLDTVHRIDDVGRGLLEDDQEDAGLTVLPSGQLRVLRSVDGAPDVADADRGPLPVGDDDIVVTGRFGQLIIVVDREAAIGGVDAALGGIDGGVDEHAADVLEAHPHRGELARVDLHPDRRLLLAADRDLPDTRDLAHLLGEDVLRIVVDRCQGRGVRGEADDENWTVGGIHFPVGRWAREVLGQLAAGGVDRRLDVAGGAVDVAVELELDGDRGVAQAHSSR